MNKKAIIHRDLFSKKAFFLAILIVFLTAAPLFSANITVPSLEIYSWARNEGTGFTLDSYGDIELQLDGGYKFGGAIKFDLTTSSLETAAINDMLAFKSVSIILRDLFNIPLDFTYFIGEGDTLASGDIFTKHFGTPLLGSLYTSYVHFPTAAAFNFYRGIHTIYGTGGKLEFAPTDKKWLLSLYIYQDSAPEFISGSAPAATLEYGHGSLDIRSAFNLQKIKLEAFLGATYPTTDSTLGYYRGGVLFHAGIKGVEFLTGFGVPLWKPGVDAFTIDLFYFMVEQRVRLGLLSVIQTVLWRPSYYHQSLTNEQAIDINLDIQIGGAEEAVLAGGIEGNFVYQLVPTDEIRAKIVPYLKISTSGVVYEVRASTKIWPLDLDFSDMFEVFFSINASF